MTSKYGDMVKSLKNIHSLECLYFKISKRIKHKIKLFDSREKKKQQEVHLKKLEENNKGEEKLVK